MPKTEQKDAPLATRVEHQPATQEPQGEPSLMAMVDNLLARVDDPSQAVDVVERMLAAHERQQDRKARHDYLDAVAHFQDICPHVPKRRTAEFNGKKAYDFASLDDVMNVAHGPMRDCGISVSYDCDVNPESKLLTVTCYVQHGVHREPHKVVLPLPSGVKVNDTQQMGMAISYGKRYALCAALNIVVTDEDNDAATMHNPITGEQEAQLQDIITHMDGISDRQRQWLLDSLGAENLSQIPAAKFEQACALLNQIADKKRERGAR